MNLARVKLIGRVRTGKAGEMFHESDLHTGESCNGGAETPRDAGNSHP